MTKALSGSDTAKKIGEKYPDAVTGSDETSVIVRSKDVLEVARFLQESLNLDYLNFMAGTDYTDYLEVVYLLTSIKDNHSIVLKTRCEDRNHPTVPSVFSLWQGADFQEREIYDLLGIYFEGHPNMKRLFLWAGFEGHPLRKDFKLEVPGGGKKE